MPSSLKKIGFYRVETELMEINSFEEIISFGHQINFLFC